MSKKEKANMAMAQRRPASRTSAVTGDFIAGYRVGNGTVRNVSNKPPMKVLPCVSSKLVGSDMVATEQIWITLYVQYVT